MANAFAPEIGVDIGASNVTPGKGASIDFSGLSNIFRGTGQAAQPSEREVKDIVLAPFVQDLEVVSQVENPIVREAQFKLLESRAYQTVGAGFRTDIKELVDSYRGISTPPPESGAGAVQKLVTDYAITEEGKIDAIHAQQKFVNPDGSVDFDASYNYLYGRALDSARRKSELQSLKERVEKRTLTAQDGYGQFVAGRVVEVNDHFDKLISNNAILSSAFDPNKSGTENILQAKMLIDQEIAKLKAQDTTYLASLGVDTTKGEFSLNPIYANIEARVKALDNILNYPETVVKELGQEGQANVVKRLYNLDPALAGIFATQEGQAVAFREIIAMGGYKEKMVQAITSPESEKELLDNFNVRSFFLNSEPANASAEMTPPVPSDAADLSTTQSNIALSEFTPVKVQAYRKLPAADQATELQRSTNLFTTISPKDVSNPNQAYAIREKYLTPMYLMLSSRGYQDYSDNNTMQTYYGEKAFEIAANVFKQSPTDGLALYKQMHKAMTTEAKRVEIRLLQNLTSMFPSDKNPLVIKEVNGRIVLGINPDASNIDRDLKMELSDIRSKMQNEQNAGYPIVVDPLFESKEAEVLVGRYSGMIFDRGRDLHDLLKNLNLLYTNFDKMPDEVKNNPAYGRILMLDALENLPIYKVETGAPTQAEAP